MVEIDQLMLIQMTKALCPGQPYGFEEALASLEAACRFAVGPAEMLTKWQANWLEEKVCCSMDSNLPLRLRILEGEGSTLEMAARYCSDQRAPATHFRDNTP